MADLIVGGDGLVGTALRAELTRRNVQHCWTSRRQPLEAPAIYCDLQYPTLLLRDDPDVVYLVAARPKLAECERDQSSWIVNVDGPIAIAAAFRDRSFIVFVSSDAVEYCGAMAYGRQKAHVETVMHAFGAAIVRPARIVPGRVSDVARVLVNVGVERKVGVTRWS